MLHSEGMQVESTALLEPLIAPKPPPTTEQIYATIFQRLKPRTELPEIKIQVRRYANANAQISYQKNLLVVKMSDILAGAPEPVQEALAEILLSKLFRQPVPAASQDRYRRFLNRKDVRQGLELVKGLRGRKHLSDPVGKHYNLTELYEDLNFRYFGGLMARPTLSWSRHASRNLLGHYDPPHNTIVLSRFLDRAKVPQVVVEYVMFHEMLHLRHPAEQRATRRCVHTRAFKKEEKQFAGYDEAIAWLKGIG